MDNVQHYVDLGLSYVPMIIIAILTLIIGFWIVGKITALVAGMLRKKEMEEGVVSFLSSALNILLKAVVLISIAGTFGVKTASFIAVLGALAFTIGMALQGTLGHFASGVLILLFKYYKIGDLVQINGVDGVVKEIQIFNTILTALDNRIIIVPNGLVTGSNIINYTAMDMRRIDMTFGIGYTDDIDHARAVIQSIVDNDSRIRKDQTNDIFVKELADSSVNFAVRLWVDTDHYWPVFFHMQESVKKAFDKEKVSIPYPQMDIHLNKLN